MVVNEAMNQRCPVIATSSVGAAAGGLVVDGETGFVVSERVSRALAAAIERIATDPALRARLGRGAAARVQQWSHERWAEGFHDAILYATRPRREH